MREKRGCFLCKKRVRRTDCFCEPEYMCGGDLILCLCVLLLMHECVIEYLECRSENRCWH